MDIVYPLKKVLGGATFNEFRYSLRSLRNLPHENVFVVGGKPAWFKGQHIRTVQTESKYLNLCHNIEVACSSDEISDPFTIFNDDFFVLEPIDEVPTRWRETPDESLIRYERFRMPGWHKHLTEIVEKIPNVHRSYELHVPMVVHKAPMLEALSITRGPLWRTAYGAVAGLGGTQLPDVKIMKIDAPVPEGPFASTEDRIFTVGKAGRELRKRFSIRSGYER